jgi:hypothetical protein
MDTECASDVCDYAAGRSPSGTCADNRLATEMTCDGNFQ